jgi:hypothetical protein
MNKGEVTGGSRKLHNEELHELNCSRYIIRVIKIKEIEMGVARITHGRDEKYVKNFGQKPERKEPLGSRRHSFGDKITNTTFQRKCVGGVNWIYVARGRNHRQTIS